MSRRRRYLYGQPSTFKPPSIVNAMDDAARVERAIDRLQTGGLLSGVERVALDEALKRIRIAMRGWDSVENVTKEARRFMECYEADNAYASPARLMANMMNRIEAVHAEANDLNINLRALR